MRIAILDYVTTDGNALGSLTKLAVSQQSEHDITIFSLASGVPTSKNVRWVRVPAIKRPQVALFVSYHLAAPIVFGLRQVRLRRRYDLVQTTESCVFFGDLAYVHFCHRAFLRRCRAEGVKLSLPRWLDHRVRALTEKHVYRRRSLIVVPSRSFGDELIEETGVTPSSVVVIPNVLPGSEAEYDADSADVEWTSPPAAGDIVLMFAALGHFERKGLPALLQALTDPALSSLRLMVVGGESGVVRDYENMVEELGIKARVVFVGLQPDLRPWFKSADAFILPSVYETFSMVCLEAAASGLPLLVSPFYGVAELIEDGVHGLVMEPTAQGVREALARFASMTAAQREEMGKMAKEAIRTWTPEEFGKAWREVYDHAALRQR